MKFHRAIEYNLTKALKELNHENIEDLNIIIHQVNGLKDSEIYEKMYNGSVKSKEIFASDAKLIKNEKSYNHLIALGFKELSKFPFYIPPFSSLISFNNLNALYSLLVLRYYAQEEKKLGYEDLKNIYTSGLDHKIIHALYKFDELSNVPQTDEKYLNALKTLQWENSDTRKLLKKLNYVKSLIGQDRFKLTYQIGIQRAEDKFILFIAGCSAINNKRDKINVNDVINAYKTYFKLINTDITRYKAITNTEIENSENEIKNGYLVCEKCNSYYKLQPSESPEDFDLECECGGKLEYYKNINWLLKEN